MIKCSECGNALSTEALTCPHCGCEREIARLKKANVVFPLMAIGFLLFGHPYTAAFIVVIQVANNYYTGKAIENEAETTKNQ